MKLNLWAYIIGGLIAILFFGTIIQVVRGEEMDLTKAVIHHTAGSAKTDRDLTVEEIDRYHRERGFDSIGYHFLIRKDGQIHTGRPLWKKGAHAKGRNNCIGIALTGYDRFTTAQLSALNALLKRLGVAEIQAHHEKCPGPRLDLNAIRAKL